MNMLSILIYLAEMCKAINFASGVLIGVCIVMWIVPFWVYWMNTDRFPSPEERKTMPVRWAFPLLWVCIIVNVITPSRNTVLLIAASEMGQRVVESEQVAGVVNPGVELLTTWMRQQTENIRKQMSQASSTNQR